MRREHPSWLVVAGAVSFLVLVGLGVLGSGEEDPAVQLERAIQLETVDGDLAAAVAQYEQIIESDGNNRALVARALLRLGGCYEKLGRREARRVYQRLVDDYADQAQQVTLARSRLAALRRDAPAAASAPRFGARADGITTRRVWTGADGVFSNAPSPNGRYVTYVDWDSGNLTVRDLESETDRPITDEGTWEQPAQMAYASRWSPHGSQIAYSWEVRGEAIELRILAVDEPKPRVVFRDESDGAWVEPQAWSPDGQQILATLGPHGQPTRLVLVPIEGGSPRVIQTFGPSTLSSGVAGFSPDGRYIVYDRAQERVAARDLFVFDLSEGVEIPLVQHSADDSVFGWSPGGDWILFLSDRAGTLDFWAIRVAEGRPQGTPVRVKRSVGRVAPLGFTQDGTYYFADVKVARDVYVARVDVEQGILLTPAEKAIERYEGSNMNPRYSPDGKSLAYISRRGSMVFPTNRGNALCVQSLEDGSERVFMDEFVRLGVHAVAGPRWSPDSRSIVVAGLRVVGANSGLYLARLDTGKVTRVAEMPAGVRLRQHEWSREKQRLFYARVDTNRGLWQVLERDLQTGEEKELYRMTDNGHQMGLALSPDGDRLAIFTNDRGVDEPRRLLVIPSRGGPPREIRRFEQGRYTNPDWTPDGRHILMGRNPTNTTAEERRGILYAVPVQGGEPAEIVLQRGFWDRVSVHPDGQRIAFGSSLNYDSDADVWAMRNFLPEPEKADSGPATADDRR
jgi:Tol biopolymer transport system component